MIDVPERRGSGYTLYTVQMLCRVEMIDEAGTLLRSWAHEPCGRWERGRLLPSDAAMTITRNYGETAKEKSDELILHLIIATISVIVLMAFFLGIKDSLVVGVAGWAVADEGGAVTVLATMRSDFLNEFQHFLRDAGLAHCYEQVSVDPMPGCRRR